MEYRIASSYFIRKVPNTSVSGFIFCLIFHSFTYYFRHHFRKMACVKRAANGWKYWMNGVRLFRDAGLKATTCAYLKSQDLKWHTSSRLYSAFTFIRPVSFAAVTFSGKQY